MESSAYTFTFNSFLAHNKRSDTDHADNDYLSFVSIASNATTKNQRIVKKTMRVGGVINSGDFIPGPFSTDPLLLFDDEVLTITYVVQNLGSSDVVNQFNEAVNNTNKIAQVAAPIVGAAIGLFVGAPAQGAAIGAKVAEGMKQAATIFEQIWVILGAPTNCNGIVLQDTLVYDPTQIRQAVDRASSREYEGPSADGCGMAPHTRADFVVHPVNLHESDWRFCNKCQSLFYDGSPTKGKCAAGGTHTQAPDAWNYILVRYVEGLSASEEHNWRYCKNCQVLYFDGSPTKGKCAAGGEHHPGDFNYSLEHGVNLPTDAWQSNWRFCKNCFSLFFHDGHPTNGRCAAGGEHQEGSFNYRLQYVKGPRQLKLHH